MTSCCCCSTVTASLVNHEEIPFAKPALNYQNKTLSGVDLSFDVVFNSIQVY